MNSLRSSRLCSDSAGVTAVKFGLIAPIALMLFLVGFFDYGYWMYVRATASGALESVARSSGVGGPTVDPSVFQSAVETQIKKLSPAATFVWNAKSCTTISRALECRRKSSRIAMGTAATIPATAGKTRTGTEPTIPTAENREWEAPTTSSIIK